MLKGLVFETPARHPHAAGVSKTQPHRHQVKEPPVFQKEEVLP